MLNLVLQNADRTRMVTEKKLEVDIEKIIASKRPAGKKGLPKFLIRLMEKLIHQDEINRALDELQGKEGVEFASGALKTLDVNWRVHGGEKLDPNKRYIFVCNHPMGGLDGMILIAHFGQQFQDVRFVVNDLLMFIEPLRCLFIPINKFGRMKADYATKIQEAFSSDAQMLYFPAGLCSRLIDGRIQDLEWKKTFVIKARESQRDIVPLYFDGRNSRFFYRLEWLRSRLGIRFNIGMALLPHEMFRQQHKTFDLYIGQPFSHEQLTNERTLPQWVEFFRNQTYRLKP